MNDVISYSIILWDNANFNSTLYYGDGSLQKYIPYVMQVV